MFIEGRTSVYDDECSGQPSLITDELKKTVDTIEEIFITLDELYSFFTEIS